MTRIKQLRPTPALLVAVVALAAGESVTARTNLRGDSEGGSIADQDDTAFSMVWVEPA